ncbi:MAG: hypothetical protein ACO1OB_26790 [Archangium sp.]
MNGRELATLRSVQTPEQARDELEAARQRLARKLENVEKTLEPLTDWREMVRRKPWVAVGGAFVAGYVLAKLFSRRE